MSLYLERVTLKDFRTFGQFEARLVPQPGLTLLVGTNGLGKSTFFDGLEWALTGEVERFKAYLPSAPNHTYLTRRNAPPGSHAVTLTFSEGDPLARTATHGPSPEQVVELLRRRDWSAPIQDIATYLAFTHFLGQTSQQRFTSRARNEQWASLKGPSGIERLEEVRNGLRGKATTAAFTRRVKQEQKQVVDIQRALAEWQGWRLRLQRLRDASAASGALSGQQLSDRLSSLANAVAKLRGAAIAEHGGHTTSQYLSLVRGLIDDTKNEHRLKLTILAGLVVLPNEYLAHRTASDPNAQPLLNARNEITEARKASENAQATAAAIRSRKQQEESRLASLRSEIEILQAARSDIVLFARLHAQHQTLEHDRIAAEGELEQRNAEIESLNGAIATAQGAKAKLDGLQLTWTAAQEHVRLAAELATLQAQARASAVAAIQASANAETARVSVSTMQSERERIGGELARSRIALDAARNRGTELAAAVAAIAGHLHADDKDCPVCATSFAPGVLKRLADSAARGQNLELAKAEADVVELSGEADRLAQATAAAEALIAAAADADAQAKRALDTASNLERRLRALLSLDKDGDITAIASERAASAGSAFAAEAANAERNDAQANAAALRRSVLRAEAEPIRERLARLREQVAQCEDAIRACAERIAARGMGEQTAEDLTAQLGSLQQDLVAAQEHVGGTASEESGVAAAELHARQRLDAAVARLAQLEAARKAAETALANDERKWREAGLEGGPDAAILAQAKERNDQALAELDRLEGDCEEIAKANEIATRNLELSELISTMNAAGGADAADKPDAHEQAIKTRLVAAEAALATTQAARDAVKAFSDKLRDEAENFSTRFLAPLNDLIDDFNEALLTTPGESIRFNAEHRVDATRFDMGMRYRDPIDDATFDTDLPPQVVLSEGQLAANGFSILCAASTAYPWSRWPALLLDDPLQHNDIIHMTAFVDVMRNLVELKAYQLIMSSHDWAEAEFISRKFDAAGLPCTVIALAAPSTEGVRYEEPRYNSAARQVLGGELARLG